MMKNMNKTGIENLCNGIVEQSAKDYANAFMGKWVENISPQDTLSKLDKFFHSEWYGQLTKVDADWLLKSIKIQELDIAIDSLKRTLTEDGLIKLCIAKKNNKDSMTYTIPPRLMSEFNKAITFCIAQLEAEKEKIISQ